MIIYNLFPLLAGPFSKWTDHFRRISDMGFNWIFVNPIQKPGYSGSLYSVADYFKINPLFLDSAAAGKPEEQVKAMTAKAHAAGLKVMIDLVVNHCAFDAPLVKEHPEWFKKDDHGNIAHPSCEENGRKKRRGKERGYARANTFCYMFCYMNVHKNSIQPHRKNAQKKFSRPFVCSFAFARRFMPECVSILLFASFCVRRETKSHIEFHTKS